MHPRSMLLLTLVVLLSIVASGCSALVRWKTPEVYVAANNVVELRGPATLPVWTTGKDGKRIRGYVNAHDRWLLGPAAPVSEVAGGGK